MERFQTLRDSALRRDLLAGLSRAGPLRRSRSPRPAPSRTRRSRARRTFASPMPPLHSGVAGRRAPPARCTGWASRCADIDGDGDLDLLDARPGRRAVVPQRSRPVRRRRRRLPGAFAAAPALAALVAGDYDNDGAPTCSSSRATGVALLHQDAAGSVPGRRRRPRPGLARRRRRPRPPRGSMPITTAISISWSPAPDDGTPALRLLRNNGDGTFTDITGAAGCRVAGRRRRRSCRPTSTTGATSTCCCASPAGRALFRTCATARSRTSPRTSGCRPATPSRRVAAGDVNKDGYTDFFFGPADGRRHARAERRPRRLHVTSRRARRTRRSAVAAQFARLRQRRPARSAVVLADGRRVLLRNVGDATGSTSPPRAAGRPSRRRRRRRRRSPSATSTATATDVVRAPRRSDVACGATTAGAAHVAPRPARRRASATAAASARRSRCAPAACARSSRPTPRRPAPAPADVVFGLGARAGADVVRVLWPSGILQAETAGAAAASALAGRLDVDELDRKPSSCPFLYHLERRAVRVRDRLPRRRRDGLLGRAGRTQHAGPGGVRPHPRRSAACRATAATSCASPTSSRRRCSSIGCSSSPSRIRPASRCTRTKACKATPEPFVLFTTRAPRAADRARPTITVTTSATAGAASIVSYRRRLRARRRPRLCARRTRSTLDAAAVGRRAARVLLLTGWTDYAFSSDNVAASQRGLALTPPSLAGRGRPGGWRTVVADIGFPVGRPQTVLVDLAGKLPPGAARGAHRDDHADLLGPGRRRDSEPAVERAADTARAGSSATLRWRGFSAEIAPDGREPLATTTTRVAPSRRGSRCPAATRAKATCAIRCSRGPTTCSSSRVPATRSRCPSTRARCRHCPPGWTRTFLLYGDGFSKEMDLHSASPDALEPLPFHGMTSYPYRPTESYPDADPSRLPRALQHPRHRAPPAAA